MIGWISFFQVLPYALLPLTMAYNARKGRKKSVSMTLMTTSIVACLFAIYLLIKY